MRKPSASFHADGTELPYRMLSILAIYQAVKRPPGSETKSQGVAAEDVKENTAKAGYLKQEIGSSDKLLLRKRTVKPAGNLLVCPLVYGRDQSPWPVDPRCCQV